jgi:Domain of unknown function (DUF4126)
MTPEALVSIGVGLALAAAAGFRVFVPLLALSLASRAGWITLSPSFEWLAATPATIALGTATILEIAAYYVPFFDNLLDSVATPLAVVAGIMASASVLTDLPPWLQYAVAIIGAGSTAGAVQGATTLLRLKSSAATAGFGNPVIATIELVSSIVLAVISLLFPILALLLVFVLFLFIGRWVGRRARRRQASVHV